MIANKDSATRVWLLNQAVLFEVNQQYKRIIEILVYDGYINYVGDSETYRFNSPIVRMWWHKYISR